MITKERLEQLLHETEEAHASFEKTLGRRDENWQAWYAEYMEMRLNQRNRVAEKLTANFNDEAYFARLKH